jgi:hypothetical protein
MDWAQKANLFGGISNEKYKELVAVRKKWQNGKYGPATARDVFEAVMEECPNVKINITTFRNWLGAKACLLIASLQSASKQRRIKSSESSKAAKAKVSKSTKSRKRSALASGR